jgi:hypothetical protein
MRSVLHGTTFDPTTWRTDMNRSLKTLLAGAALIAVSSNVYARGGEDCDCMERGAMMRMDPERMEKMHERRLSGLHEKLKLSAQQEAAWKKFAAREPLRGKADRPDPDEMKRLNAPQRLEQALEHMRAMEKNMTEHLAALKEFYAVLTPEQKRTFDEQMPGFGERGHRHGR